MTFNNHFLVTANANVCQYDNRTYGMNQTVITRNCKEMCGCNSINGTTIPTCKPLCQSQEDLRCNPDSQDIEEFQSPLNGTKCTCTRKRCIPGLRMF